MSGSVFDEDYSSEEPVNPFEEAKNPFEETQDEILAAIPIVSPEITPELVVKQQIPSKSSNHTDICDEIDQLSEQIVGVVASIEHVAHNFADSESKFEDLSEKMSEIIQNQSEIQLEMKNIYKTNLDLIKLVDNNNTQHFLLEGRVKELIDDVQELKLEGE